MDLFSSPPPLAPPTSEGNELSWLRLLRSRRVGPQTFRRLMEEHQGCADAALTDLPQIARSAGVTDYVACTPAQAQSELSAGRRAGAIPLFWDNPAYPDRLAGIPDAPPLLWARGRTDLLGEPTIGMVGARNASSLGLRTARTLARSLGEAKIVTVSGLARGIDAEVHRETLRTGTIAVVAGGVDVVYPQENKDLMQEIARVGLILSEMPPGYRPQARHFPRRNRIVAGLSGGLVVVEAAAKSGSLITAREAADLGRDVFAVPGHPFDARAAGCNLLIRDGATLVRGIDDILEGLPASSRHPPPRGATRPSPEVPKKPAGSGPAVPILEQLGPSPVHEDQLLRTSGLTRSDFAALVTELELQGSIERAPGGFLSRATLAPAQHTKGVTGAYTAHSAGSAHQTSVAPNA